MVDYSCAIKLTGPLAVNAALLEAADHGALVRGGMFLERLSAADAIVLDKTGTLTVAEPKVVDLHVFGEFDPDFVLANAACLEEHFPHPVARAVVRRAEELGLNHEERHSEPEFIVAHGIASRLDGKRILVGSGHFVRDDEGVDVSISDEIVARWGAQGLSALYVSIGEELAAVLAIDDPVRPEAEAFVTSLRGAGFGSVTMLTGGSERAAQAVADAVGVNAFRAQVLPDEKVEVVTDLQATGHTVVMLGDGMNDSAAISRACVGVSLDYGADLAQQAADAVLLGGRLESLVDARRISERLIRRVRRQSALIIGANSAFMAMGLLGAPAPLLALLHNATTVATGVSALRPYLPERTER